MLVIDVQIQRAMASGVDGLRTTCDGICPLGAVGAGLQALTQLIELYQLLHARLLLHESAFEFCVGTAQELRIAGRRVLAQWQ